MKSCGNIFEGHWVKVFLGMIIVCSGLTKPTCPTKVPRNKSVNLIFDFTGKIFLANDLN